MDEPDYQPISNGHAPSATWEFDRSDPVTPVERPLAEESEYKPENLISEELKELDQESETDLVCVVSLGA